MQDKNTTDDIKILTPSGFQLFNGVARYKHTKKVKNFGVYTALDHKFIIDDKEVFARDLNDNHEDCDEYFYDPVNVRNGNIYYHDNSILSHNTFHGTGNTLINAETLLALKAKDPISVHNNVRIYEDPIEGHNYLIFVDVSKGRGMDYSTFNVIDVSVKPFKQVAVYQDNMMSPLLFPDIIYKYANHYNESYVIIESNDQGAVVCNGLYYDLEYENVFVESMVKANAIGVTMTRKIKRIGCATIKDIMEQNKLEIADSQTIQEMSTFIARGSSYEADHGNHDDLMMNLVMFGWFSTTPFFAESTDINMKNMLYAERVKQIEDDLIPIGVFGDDDYSEQPGEPQWEVWKG